MEMHEKPINELELTDQQEEEVIAGAEAPGSVKTVMRCEECRYQTNWLGDYLNDLYYDCPHCHRHAFHGILYFD